MNASDFERFIANVTIVGECWNWTGGMWGTYGRFVINGDNYAAHVLSFKHFVGPVPAGLFVCHECDNRICVNPNHLFLGTCRDNWDDMVAKGRHARGERQRDAKITEEDAINIRRLRSEGVTATAIAKWYGLHVSTVCKIIRDRLWKHIAEQADTSISTQARGSRINTAKLTEEQIPMIRSLHAEGWSYGMLAEQFGVQAQTIGNIIRGKRWKHVP